MPARADAPPPAQGALDDLQRRLLDSLRIDGIAVTRYDDLLTEPSFPELAADAAPFVAAAEERARAAGPAPRKKRDIIIRRFEERGEGAARHRFALDDLWVRVGVSDRVLDVVNAYRDQDTSIYNIDLWYTVPFPAADTRIGSQRWHRDPAEEHVVKLFLYLSDVDADAGPFEYVRGSPSGGRYGHLWPWSRDDRHPPEDELYAAVDPADRLTLTGPAGTVILCDTGGFHRGGFAHTTPRVLATWTYVSPAAGLARRFEVDIDGRADQLPAKVRTALA